MATTDKTERTGGAGEWRERYEKTPERQGELFSTISGVENEPLYSPDDVEIDYERDLGWPGSFPFTRGVYPSMYRGRLWTMRQFAGFGTAEETNERFRYLTEHGQTGLSHRVRHADADGLRLRPSALARRGRPRGRRDRLARRHGDALRRDPARRGLDLDDDQRPGRDAARVLRVRRRGAGRAARRAARDRPDGHPQGVHRAEGVDLPAAPVDAARRRHGRVVRRAHAAHAPGLDLRVPHPRGRLERGAGACVHAVQRVRAGRGMSRARLGHRLVRAAVVVLFQRASRLLRGDREVPRGAPDLGDADAGQVRREGSAELAHAVPHADRRRVAHGAAAGGQSHPHRDRGARGRAWAGRSRSTRTRSTKRWRCRPSTQCGSRCARSR